jgi:ribonuclease G
VKQIVVNCAALETRIAIMEHGKLTEFLLERPVEQRLIGNVYKGKVANVLPGMQAAFVDLGTERNGFLYIDDCLPEMEKTKKASDSAHKPNIREVLTEGQEILVQVTKEPMGTKGPRLTTHLGFPGRFLVYTPEAGSVGISRRIEQDQERERLRVIADKLLKENEGVIVRTVAEGAEKEELEADFLFLRGLWEKTKANVKVSRPPRLVYQDLDLVSRIARDFLTEEVDEFIIDKLSEYHKVLEQLDHSINDMKNKVKLYQGRTSIFDAYEVEPELEKILKKKVWLKNGGYLVIDQTEALTIIDINTGKYTGTHNLEETVFKTNKEAAKEIPRQLQLRDIGGIILIDFIDMAKLEHREEIVKRLESGLKKDRTKSHILGFTRLGLLEMTRKKVRQNVSDQFMSVCPLCEGRGKILSEETVAGKAERDIKEYAQGKDVEAILVEVHPRVSKVLIGKNHENIKRIESALGIRIYIRDKDSMNQEQVHIAFVGSEAEVRQRAQRT